METIKKCFLTILEARRKNKIRRLTNSAPDKGYLSSTCIAVFSLFVTKQRETETERQTKIQRDGERKTKTDRDIERQILRNRDRSRKTDREKQRQRQRDREKERTQQMVLL